MSPAIITEHEYENSKGEKFFYLAAGSYVGPLLIFIHGWPAIAETWKPQLLAFAALGFRVVAPDNRGYGRSVVNKESSAYALERHVADMRGLLAHLEREEAVWIGHDWGAALIWALAAHHPEACRGVVNMCVPYRTVEFGLEALVATVNREIYPADKYPKGQWDYLNNYEVNIDATVKALDANPATSAKVFYMPGNPATYGKPSRLATTSKEGGFFGGAPEAPDVPLEITLLKDDEELYKLLRDSLARNGFFGPCSYYINHAANKIYSEKSANGGVLSFPVLFIDAKYDSLCSTSLDRLNEAMRKYCRDLTETSIEAGHWVALEKPRETNAVIARWLATKVETYWPGYFNRPFVYSSGKEGSDARSVS
jgi:soluble epoxide hydrolase / lipid-phosphate phosphatase